MYHKGFVPKIWDDEYKKFDYVRQPITGEEADTWRSQGYTHETTTGKMYDSRNPMPDWVNTIANLMNLRNPGFVFYRMDTLDIMPTHVDHFNTYCRVFNKDRKEVRRAIVFLEDWKPGHYFQIDNVGVVNYKAGEYVLWAPDVPHAASNIGVEPRYTLQITGTYY
tara:strand:- start:11825 stop:12319 length:495 start_codon:yes stop_codon:yes gene_type:complete